MSVKNRVIWSEGLFIRPHHFQQEFKFNEHNVNQKIQNLNPFFFGFRTLEINKEYLGFGKVGIQLARGVLPDGTSFELPNEAPLPEPLTIEKADVTNQKIYLCLPLKVSGVREVLLDSDTLGGTRLKTKLIDIKDTFSEDGNYANLGLAELDFKLMLEKDDRSKYTSLAIARIASVNPDKSIILDDKFYATSISISSIPRLKDFLVEVASLMRERAKSISERVGSPSQSGVADVTDFMMLLALNRMHPYFIHLSKLNHLDLETLYSALIMACGELSTFVQEGKLPEAFLPYDHEEPHISIIPLEVNLKQILSSVMSSKAIPIPIVFRDHGVHVAAVHDVDLIKTASFVLAVRADMPAGELKTRFTQQTKISSIDKIRELINLQLPGVPLIPLPVAPRHLPYHAGFTYFQLDSDISAWKALEESSGFGFHISGEYKNLELEFWAIRSDKI